MDRQATAEAVDSVSSYTEQIACAEQALTRNELANG